MLIKHNVPACRPSENTIRKVWLIMVGSQPEERAEIREEVSKRNGVERAKSRQGKSMERISNGSRLMQTASLFWVVMLRPCRSLTARTLEVTSVKLAARVDQSTALGSNPTSSREKG